MVTITRSTVAVEVYTKTIYQNERSLQNLKALPRMITLNVIIVKCHYLESVLIELLNISK